MKKLKYISLFAMFSLSSLYGSTATIQPLQRKVSTWLCAAMMRYNLPGLLMYAASTEDQISTMNAQAIDSYTGSTELNAWPFWNILANDASIVAEMMWNSLKQEQKTTQNS